MMNIVQSLWVGNRLSTMEQIAIRSFLEHGHAYHLYTYEPVENLPPGAVELEAEAILPASAIFEYANQKSFAGFSNFFRYKLLLERGGWWVDTDVVCLADFDFATPYVFASEEWGDEKLEPIKEVPASAILKAPPNSEAMQYAWDVCQSKNIADLVWGETGPRLVAEIIRRFALEKYLRPASVFCPVAALKWDTVLQPGRDLRSLAGSHALHLWNEMWRRKKHDKEGTYDPTCLYEQLKRHYLSASCDLHEVAAHQTLAPASLG